jgi:tRNA pseudouridine38-40 synthase
VVDEVRDPHLRTRAWRLPDLSVSLLDAERHAAVGTHDFAAFRCSGDTRPSTVRTITRVDVIPEDVSGVISIVVEGNAFLHNMVRILVGTMVDVARSRLDPGAVGRALVSRDRRTAGTTAPAHGLTLEHIDVELPSESGDRWPQ